MPAVNKHCYRPWEHLPCTKCGHDLATGAYIHVVDSARWFAYADTGHRYKWNTVAIILYHGGTIALPNDVRANWAPESRTTTCPQCGHTETHPE